MQAAHEIRIEENKLKRGHSELVPSDARSADFTCMRALKEALDRLEREMEALRHRVFVLETEGEMA